jgi:Flp pilus assembly protein CpaB
MGDVTPRTGIELPIDPATGVMYNAMAIKVDPATVVGGLVVPGAKVDVVCVERRPNGKTSSTMILQNVLVVGVNETTVRPDDQGYIKNAQTVTLAVKQQEGMILALAGERGKVSLMLRDPNNNKIKKNIREVVDYQPRSREDEPTEGTSLEKTKVAIAKQTIAAGTKIDDPTDYFEEMDWPSTLVPDNFITKIDDLKGKTVVKDLLKNSPVVKEAFEGEAPKTDRSAVAGANPKSDVNRHTITFQVGGSMPYYAHFKNGKLEDATQPPAPAGQTPSNVITPPADNKIDQNQ